MSEQEQLKIKNMASFRPLTESIYKEREMRIPEDKLSFGIKFFDEVLGGIYSNDLIIVGAKTGIGKTQLATIAAMTNARKKRVHYFALEAEENEIERRIKYQTTAKLFYGGPIKLQHPNLNLNYMDWRYGKFNQEFDPYENEINEMIADSYPGLNCFYRVDGSKFTAETLKKSVLSIQDQTDLIIIDHLHFFDIEDENENRGMKDLMMTVRDLALLVNKPFIVVAHMRKTDKRSMDLMPDIEDFHGSSDISKICTKAITIAPANIENVKNNWWTYLRAAKCRPDNSRTRWIGLSSFNSTTDKYDNRYFVSKFHPSKFSGIEKFNEMPYWAKGADIWTETGDT